MSGPDGSGIPADPAAGSAAGPAEVLRERRFGLFVHWGLYSIAARTEWMWHRERQSIAEYERYLKFFDPDLFDPDQWVERADAAGMRYLVITTKHHDGFCLWDSALTDYSVTATPWGRDLIGPIIQAARRRGMQIGLYHSLIDWHHPDFPIDGLHPLRDDAEAVGANHHRDITRYRTYLHGQVRELLTRYGAIDELWFDFSYQGHVHEGTPVWGGKGPEDWGSAELVAMVRALQPGILINDRTGLAGDFVTPEQYQPSEPPTRDGRPVHWEACQTLNGSWGYDRDNHDDKSLGMLIRMLIDTVSKDGNLLLNVGPTARGEFDARSTAALDGIGQWMRVHQRSIHGAGRSDFQPPPDCRYTQRGDRLYLHLFAWPFETVHLPGLAGKVEHAQFLNDASEVRWEDADPDREAYATTAGGQPIGTLTLELPVRQPEVAVPVIELFLRS
ncbi:MAG TPA: alpha-L-fucosidase [Kineosporiaceae bacterium]|nr:alpha-L-fucosidase [Kineosporiaceae bacterium]